MILYFSGTGNSLLVARMLQKLTGDEMESIAELRKNGIRSVASNGPFVVVAPIYAWKIPHFVEEFINEASFKGSDMMYFVMTCGQDSGFNAKYVENLCKSNKLVFMGESDIVMPDNYLIMDNPPDKEEAEAEIRGIVSKVKALAECISMGKKFDTVPRYGILKTYVISPLFYKFFIDCPGFHTTELCDGCGHCVQYCPTDCISMEGGRPVWTGNCIQCLSCINRCPVHAIEFKSKTVGKNRYVCPIDDPSELLDEKR